MVSKHKNDCTLILGAFFSNQSISSTTFTQISPKLAQISPNLPEKTFALPFWALFFKKTKHIKRFCEGLHTFCPNFHRFCLDFKRFCQDFHQIKTFGGALSPPAPPPSTPLALDIEQSQIWTEKASSKQD